MKYLKTQFANKIQFVKPLYKKVNPNKHVSKHTYLTIDFDNRSQLCGHGRNVDHKTQKIFKRHKRVNNYVRKEDGKVKGDVNMLKITAATTGYEPNHVKVKEFWLRVYPAPIIPGEKLTSIIFRFAICQIGLGTFLALWTISWMVIINHFEGPFEQRIADDFRNAQSQLVIDLATELRQVTPVSPKWRRAIEARIDEEKKLTMEAVASGARLNPGRFWDMGGTFLFTIFVMTALGFGAPVPQTLWGRTAGLVYAVVAIPMHIYLMVQLGTCVVVSSERGWRRLQRWFNPTSAYDDKNILENTTHLNNKSQSPNTTRNSEALKSTSKSFRNKIIKVLPILWTGHGVPLTTLIYYVLGAVSFGVGRNKDALAVLMFPLEFTTTGGLEQVEPCVKTMYGFYVEGAMVILSCVIAGIKRHSTKAVSNMATKYRLFVYEDSAQL